jgi:putative tricarboxylic transport membrane protein
MSFWNAVNKSELVAAGLLIALGVSIVVQASGWVYLTPDGPGPGFFPFWTGWAMIVLAAVLAVRHVLDVLGRRPVERINWRGSMRSLMGWAAFTVSIGLLYVVGFVASFLLLTVFLVMVIFRRSLKAALAVGLGASAGFWVLFVKLLDVRLPQGPWGF